MARPNMYMLIGLPGTGKSTWWERYPNETGVAYISSDAIIERIATNTGKTYNEVFKTAVKVAEKEMYQQVMQAVKEEKDIVWDQTNLNKKTRAKKLIMIPDHYRKLAIYFGIPADHEQRLANRPGKTIPAHILKTMAETVELPDLEEGFSVVVLANNKYIDEEGTDTEF